MGHIHKNCPTHLSQNSLREVEHKAGNFNDDVPIEDFVIQS